MELHQLREQIDAIDDQLVRLFCARMEVAAQVADYKKANDLPIYHPDREQEILREMSEKAGPELESYTRGLYTMLFELSRSYQSKRNSASSPLYRRIKSSIQEGGNDHAHCICISRNLEIYPGADKTTIMMVLPHRPGSLYKVLARLYVLGINVLKLESRSIPNRDSEFMFCFDLQTSVRAEEFILLMCELDDLCEDFRCLGSNSEVV